MNLKQTFSVLLWLNKAKTNEGGLAPIWARITIDGRRAEVSAKRYVIPKHWSAEFQRVKKDCEDSEEINSHLSAVESQIGRHYNMLLKTEDYVSADDVKRSFSGVKEEKQGLLEVFEMYLKVLKERASFSWTFKCLSCLALM